MNLLVDTHVLLWLMFGDDRLGDSQLAVLESADHAIYVSSVSIFEIANKVRIGKLPISPKGALALANVCEQFGFGRVELTMHHAQMAGLIPNRHRDPFDRMLAAQSIVENMPIMSVDDKLKELGAEVVW